MSKLNVGDWVTTDRTQVIGKITQDGGEYGSIKFRYNGHIVEFDDEVIKYYRKATVLDYLRTLSAEQMRDLIYRIAQEPCEVLCLKEMEKCTGIDCKANILKFLNQPLTDELVEQLGGGYE